MPRPDPIAWDGRKYDQLERADAMDRLAAIIRERDEPVPKPEKFPPGGMDFILAVIAAMPRRRDRKGRGIILEDPSASILRRGKWHPTSSG